MPNDRLGSIQSDFDLPAAQKRRVETMTTTVRWLALSLGLGLLATQAVASTTVGIYAIVDEVAFEPSDFEPERVWISGVFVVPQPLSSGLHRPPLRGHLYFSLNPDAPRATRGDWDALQAVAGTGQVAGFGEYWMPCSKTRSEGFSNLPADANCSFEATVLSDRSAAVSEPYPAPSSAGVVTTFDAPDDVCPRFGRPSVQIIVDLREAHSPGVVQREPPVCAERIGLVSSSSLDSAFVTQTRDAEWAQATESLILRRLAQAPGLELAELGVECRDTICHIRLAFPSREYQEIAGNRLAADALNELPGFAPGGKILPPRDAPTVDYYLQRREQGTK